jgi:DNA-binding CsgD family transcriptional regulator
VRRRRLTPAVLRTARMAADGLTNREIARALVVSRRPGEAKLHQATRRALRPPGGLGERQAG